MPIIDQSKLPPEITSKYSVANNAFRMDKIKNAELDTYKNEPKDEINIFVGDDKIPDTFVPQLKLERWSNEANFSIRLVDDEFGQETVNTLADKIVWEKGNKKIEFYDFTEGEGGYKLVPYLKKKPKTNQIKFSVKKKGLEFYKQPEISDKEAQEQLDFYNQIKAKGRPTQYTDEEIVRFTLEIASGLRTEFPPLPTEEEWQTHVSSFPTTLLEVKRKMRPIEVVNSYAIYHSTKGGMVDKFGKDYKSGKAFHDFRPHFFDANGMESWGDIDYIWTDAENGERIVTIPQEFLDNAVYPIKSNDTFGYTTLGNSTRTVPSASQYMWGTDFTSPSDMGTVSKMTIGVSTSSGSQNAKAVIVLQSNLNIISNGVSNGIAVTTKNFYDVTFATNPIPSASTLYYMTVVNGYNGTSTFLIYYDVGSPNNGYRDTTNNYNTPTNPTDRSSTDYGGPFSIYATYTPSGGVVKDLQNKANIKVSTNKDLQSKANIKTGNNKDLKVKGSIVSSSLKYIQSKANVSFKNSKSLTVKANIGVNNFKDLQSKANVSVKNAKILQAKANISAITLKDLQVKANIAVKNFKDLKSKANIRVVNLKYLSAKADIKVSKNQDLKAKANIQVKNLEDLKIKGSIKSSINRDLKSRANVLTSSLKDLKGKASIFVKNSKNLQSKTNIVTPSSKDLRIKANILTEAVTTRKDLQIKAYLTSTPVRDLQSKANIGVKNFEDLKIKGNVVVSTLKNLQIEGNIRRLSNKDIQSKANIFVINLKNLQSKANIGVIVYQDLKAKADITGISRKDLKAKANIVRSNNFADLKVKGNVVVTTPKDLKAKANIYAEAIIRNKDLQSRANISILNIQKDLQSKASIKVAEYKNLKVKANIKAISNQDLKVKADILKVNNQKDLQSKASIKVNNLKDLQSKANVLSEINRNLQVKANILNILQQDLQIKGYVFNRIDNDIRIKANIVTIGYRNLQVLANIVRVIKVKIYNSKADVYKKKQDTYSAKADVYSKKIY